VKGKNKKLLKSIKRKIRYFFLYYILKVTLAVAKYIPEIFMYKFCELAGLAFFYISKNTRQTVIDNLNKAFGEKPDNIQLARDVFLNTARNAAEMAMWKKYDRKKLLEMVSVEGLEHIDKALKKGRGAIMLSAHCGNWELVPASFAAHDITGTVIGRKMKDERIDRLIKQMRESKGYKIIDRDSSMRELLRVLKNNGLIGILADQDIKSIKGVFVNFFGHPAYTPVAPVVIALASKCAVLPTFIARDKNNKYKHKMIIHPELEFCLDKKDQDTIIRNTQLWSDCVENHIRQYPGQWVWFHKRWKTTPEQIKHKEKE